MQVGYWLCVFKQPVLSMHIDLVGWLLSGNSELCCQHTAIVRSIVVLPYIQQSSDWVTAKCETEAFSTACAVRKVDCEDWLLSSGHSLVVEYWRLRSRVLGLITCDYLLFAFSILLHNIKYVIIVNEVCTKIVYLHNTVMNVWQTWSASSEVIQT